MEFENPFEVPRNSVPNQSEEPFRYVLPRHLQQRSSDKLFTVDEVSSQFSQEDFRFGRGSLVPSLINTERNSSTFLAYGSPEGLEGRPIFKKRTSELQQKQQDKTIKIMEIYEDSGKSRKRRSRSRTAENPEPEQIVEEKADDSVSQEDDQDRVRTEEKRSPEDYAQFIVKEL